MAFVDVINRVIKGFGGRKRTSDVVKLNVPPYFEERIKYLTSLDIKQYPFNLKLKVDEVEGTEGYVSLRDKVIFRILKSSSNIVRRLRFLESLRRMFHNSLKAYIKEAHFPYPSYAYSSLLTFLTLILIIDFTITIIASFIEVLAPLFTIGTLIGFAVFLLLVYLYMFPKQITTGLERELDDVLLMWYSISKAGIPPQEQFILIFKILNTYRILNSKTKGSLPSYKMYHIFRDIYNDIVNKNISVIYSLERQIPKIRDEKVRRFFLRLLRAMKSGVNISDVIKSEIYSLNAERVREIERMGDRLAIIMQMYMTILVLFIGMVNVLRIAMSSLSGIDVLLESLNSSLWIAFMMPVVATILVVWMIRRTLSKYMLDREITSPLYEKIGMTLFTIVALLVFPKLSTSTGFYFLTLAVYILISAFVIKVYRDRRKTIEDFEYEFPDRIMEVSTSISMGVKLPDAFKSGMTTDDYSRLSFGDVVFLFISAYIKMGKSLKKIFYKFLIKIPSKLVRHIFGIISFTEEMSGNFADFLFTIGELIDQRLETIKLAIQTVNGVKFMIPISSIVMIVIVGVISAFVAPMSSEFEKIFESQTTSATIDQYPFLSFMVYYFSPGGGYGLQDARTYPLTAVLGYVTLVVISFALSIALVLASVDRKTYVEFLAYFVFFYSVLMIVVYFSLYTFILNPEKIVEFTGGGIEEIQV